VTNPASLLSMIVGAVGGTGAVAVAVPLTVNVTGVVSPLLLPNATVPVKTPSCDALRRIAKFVDAPGANVVLPKPEATEKPVGTVIDWSKTKLLVPVFVAVNVFVSGLP